jgi:hypothetical protein
LFLPRSPYLNDICPIFLLLFLPLDAALLFDVNAAIVGWLRLAVQLYKRILGTLPIREKTRQRTSLYNVFLLR